MNRLLIFLIAISIGCQKRDIISEARVSFYIDKGRESLIQHAVASATCNNIFVNSIDFSNISPIYSLEIKLLKTGKISNVKLVTKERKRYETQLFNPDKYLSVTNFVYDSLTKRVSFNLNGKLFIPQSINSIDINSEFKNLIIESSICKETENHLLGTIQSQTTAYRTETISSVSSKEGTIYYQYFYLTNNFRMVFKSSSSFKDIPVGIYQLGANATAPLSIIFQEYVGSSDLNNFNIYKENEWQNYNINGSINIERHIVINNSYFTSGVCQFKASNQLENRNFEFKNGSFVFFNID